MSEIEDDPELSLKSEDEEAENKAKCSTCDVCNAVFRKPYDLKIHRRVHTGERPYKVSWMTELEKLGIQNAMGWDTFFFMLSL